MMLPATRLRKLSGFLPHGARVRPPLRRCGGARSGRSPAHQSPRHTSQSNKGPARNASSCVARSQLAPRVEAVGHRPSRDHSDAHRVTLTQLTRRRSAPAAQAAYCGLSSSSTLLAARPVLLVLPDRGRRGARSPEMRSCDRRRMALPASGSRRPPGFKSPPHSLAGASVSRRHCSVGALSATTGSRDSRAARACSRW